MFCTSKQDCDNIDQSSHKPAWVFHFHYSGQKFWLSPLFGGSFKTLKKYIKCYDYRIISSSSFSRNFDMDFIV